MRELKRSGAECSESGADAKHGRRGPAVWMTPYCWWVWRPPATSFCPCCSKLSFPGASFLENFDRENFLRHCLGTGLAAQLLCIEAGLSEQYDSYKLINYGLIHDIGILALDRCLPVTLNRIFQIATEERIPILQAEVKVLGPVYPFRHWRVGVWKVAPACGYPQRGAASPCPQAG